ncbi:MAG: hypothetical protein AAF215_25940 [Cyanobacteria bacterium P01_A01_bin.123]
MDLQKLLIQLVIAIVCAGLANFLVPRRIPGKLIGLVLIGLAGVLLGEWVVNFFARQYGFSLDILTWGIQDVPIIPSVLGSTIILYVVTTFLSWGRYGGRG